MIKIFGYVRESTMQQAMFGYNIEEQKRVISDYCKYHYQDYKLEIFTEMGKSARSLNRPELKNLLDTVKKSKADKVVFHSLDRLTRDIKDLYMLIDFFDKNKIELVSVMESLDLSTAIGRSHVFNSGVYAQLESERTSERTIRAYKQAIVEGKYPFPKSPLGYDKIDKRLYPSKDEQQIEIIKYIFNTIGNNKSNYVEVSEEIAIKFNFDVDEDYIRKIVQNKLYIGVMEYRGIVNDEYCEALVDPELFNKASKFAKKKKVSKWKCDYLFKNIVFCSDCNQPMNQTSGIGKRKKRYSYYLCPECGRRASQIKIINKHMYQLQKLTNEYYISGAGFFEKKKEISKLRDKQRMIVEKQKRSAIDTDTFYELYISYDEQITDLQNQLDSIVLKNDRFDELESSMKKEIINKYIKEVQVTFTPKSYRTLLVCH